MRRGAVKPCRRFRRHKNGFGGTVLKIYISLQKKKINLPYNCSCFSNVCFADSLSKTFSP
ncbi:hypothetical protein NEILACOT_04113 [Neisseria lactamica ATCC 23970]|uniref:Uncharacterized protein n=1 Tax=Neisseria lactamica ATCC 23970 TaxID=546265 RepID=D0W9A5_NEILA|nr:hypothetical protein NEILACOT_04113 [Neisseria lactamica ATCC 23970]